MRWNIPVSSARGDKTTARRDQSQTAVISITYETPLNLRGHSRCTGTPDRAYHWLSEDCLSTFLGFEIERDASNQLICIRCRKYVPWSCWAKEGGCDCEDIRVRFFALHAWIQAGGRSANWDRRSARRSSYEPHYATYLRKEIKESQDSFFRKQRDFLKLQEKI